MINLIKQLLLSFLITLRRWSLFQKKFDSFGCILFFMYWWTSSSSWRVSDDRNWWLRRISNNKWELEKINNGDAVVDEREERPRWRRNGQKTQGNSQILDARRRCPDSGTGFFSFLGNRIYPPLNTGMAFLRQRSDHFPDCFFGKITGTGRQKHWPEEATTFCWIKTKVFNVNQQFHGFFFVRLCILIPSSLQKSFS